MLNFVQSKLAEESYKTYITIINKEKLEEKNIVIRLFDKLRLD